MDYDGYFEHTEGYLVTSANTRDVCVTQQCSQSSTYILLHHCLCLPLLSHTLSWSEFCLHLSEGKAWLHFILRVLHCSVSFYYCLFLYYPQMTFPAGWILLSTQGLHGDLWGFMQLAAVIVRRWSCLVEFVVQALKQKQNFL